MFEREFNQLERKPELMLQSNEKNSMYWSEIHQWRLLIDDGIRPRAKETDLRSELTVRQVLVISSLIRGWHEGKKRLTQTWIRFRAPGRWQILDNRSLSTSILQRLTSSLPVWRRTSVCFCLCRWHLCDYEREVCCDMVSVCRGPF